MGNKTSTNSYTPNTSYRDKLEEHDVIFWSLEHGYVYTAPDGTVFGPWTLGEISERTPALAYHLKWYNATKEIQKEIWLEAAADTAASFAMQGLF